MCAKDCCPPKKGAGVEIVCKCETRMQRFLQPCLLLLLKIKPSYGYELLENLHQFGFDELPDPATAYKNLRLMEQEGWVRSKWDTAGPGPARRIYQVTREGEDLVRSWAVAIRRTQESLNTFLSLYRREFDDESETETR
jgi:poly-beta-hydroxybutyrate-responsive repressor